MKNLVLEEELGTSLPLEEGEDAVHCCLNSTEQPPKLYMATSLCNVLCLSLDSLQASVLVVPLACAVQRI